MGFFEAISNISVLTLLYYLAAFVVAITCIVFIHEFGHFIVGRWCGVKVDTFSVGFGRELVGFTDRHGTRWKLATWPIGGYVKFEGDANAASLADKTVKHSPTSLHGRPVWQRMLIVAAGPFANFLFAAVIYTMFYTFLGEPYQRPTIDRVVAGSVAEKAGIKAGDKITAIDGKTITSFDQVSEAIAFKAGEIMQIEVDRAGQNVALSVVPGIREVPDLFGRKMKIGLLGIEHLRASDEPLLRPHNPATAFVKSVDRVWYLASTSAKQFGRILTGSLSYKQLGGAGSMGKVAGDAASKGPLTFIEVVAMLSIAVGLVNLLPIPMLDGGHLVFFAIEAVRGKPLGPMAQEWGFRIGFACVAMLFLVGNFNDLGGFLNLVFKTS